MVLSRQNRLEHCQALLGNELQFAIRKVRALLRASGMTRPPFLPERLAHLQGIKRIVKEDLGDLSGLLIPLDDGFEMKINATHSPQKQNFTCAHEIAHTFFLGDKGEALVGAMTRQKASKVNGDWLENICDMAAAELLMPAPVFRQYASRYHFHINSLTSLCRIFHTALVPTAIRLCDVSPRWSFLIRWTRNQADGLDDFKLRANWLTWSRMRLLPRTGRFFFNPKLRVPSPSVLEAYRSDKHTYSHGIMEVANFRGYCQMWSQGFGSGADRVVMSLILPECDN